MANQLDRSTSILGRAARTPAFAVIALMVLGTIVMPSVQAQPYTVLHRHGNLFGTALTGSSNAGVIWEIAP